MSIHVAIIFYVRLLSHLRRGFGYKVDRIEVKGLFVPIQQYIEDSIKEFSSGAENFLFMRLLTAKFFKLSCLD